MIGHGLVAVAPFGPAAPFRSIAFLVGIATLLNVVATANGVPALFTPLAEKLADASGPPLLTVLMVQVIGDATPVLPYQTSPIVVVIGMGQVPARDGLRLCLATAAVSFAVLVPLDYLWLTLLGQPG